MPMPIEAQVDAVLCKLSEAKAGDVLVLRSENYRDARQLSEALGRVRLPPGTLPKGGVPIVICPPEVEWIIGKGPVLDAHGRVVISKES